MSHLKKYETNIDNLTHLRSALNRMNISYHVSGQNIILSQMSNNNSASFRWNGESYILFYDMDFWTNPLTINSFIEKIKREYSAEKVVQGMNKFDFSIESYEDSSQSDKYQTIKAKDLIFSRYSFL